PYGLPSSPTLFPYTTLFRSGGRGAGLDRVRTTGAVRSLTALGAMGGRRSAPASQVGASEAHPDTRDVRVSRFRRAGTRHGPTAVTPEPGADFPSGFASPPQPME